MNTTVYELWQGDKLLTETTSRWHAERYASYVDGPVRIVERNRTAG